jgi:hypothetical protein
VGNGSGIPLKNIAVDENKGIVFVPTLRSWIALILSVIGLIGAIAAIGRSYYMVCDRAGKVPGLERKVKRIEVEIAVDREGNWALSKEIMRKLDPDGAESRITQIEAMKQAMLNTLEEQEKQNGGN